MKIGIVVPFYNGHRWLNKLVESYDHAAKDLECTLYIIDNSPLNKVVEITYNSKMPVKVIRESPSIGYGKANNRGYEICKELGYDYVIISNQDAYVSQNFIRDLLVPFHQDDRIAISAPLLKTYEGNSIEEFFIIYYLSQVPALVSDLIEGKLRDYYELRKISGACFAFRLKNKRYTYPYLFDPIFHMYMEDEDLCLRLHRLNEKIVLCLPAVFYHQHAHTTDLENKEVIQADKLVSEKILRLKDGSKSSAKALYGIFVTTVSSFSYHILRGEFYKSYLHVRSFAIIFYKLPAILKIRRQDLLNSKA